MSKRLASPTEDPLWLKLLLGAVAAVLCGIALAAVAAVYPSFKAAKLAPREAMRTE